jgi:ABC-2 type transport system permease protein
MSNAIHIATREYAENARTKGFWINMLMFPIILLLSVKVPKLLEEKAKPIRQFALVDQSGELGDIVRDAVERDYARLVMEKLGTYGKKYAKEQAVISADVLETTPMPSDLASRIDELMDYNEDLLQQMMSPEAIEMQLEFMKPSLVEDAPEFVLPRRRYEEVDLAGIVPAELDLATAKPEDIVRTLRPALVDDERLEGMEQPLFALVIIPPDAFEQILDPTFANAANAPEALDGIQFWSTNLTDMALSDLIERALDRELQTREYVANGLDPQQVALIRSTTFQFSAFDPKKKEGEEAVSVADTLRKWAPVGFVYLLWVAIFTVVSFLLNNTVEEKSNRIIEVLLSSATPWEIMVGKLLGIAGVGLTMMTAWILSLLGVLKFIAGPEVEWAGALFEVIQSSGLLPLFALYFVCGYLTYAGIFLAIGSLCNTVKEAQNFMGTATVILMVPLFTMVFVAQDPNGALATFLTWVPVYTPFVMMNRAAADPPMAELLGTGALMLVTIVFMLWLSSRIFRIGVLRTGQPPKVVELVKSLMTPLNNQ